MARSRLLLYSRTTNQTFLSMILGVQSTSKVPSLCMYMNWRCHISTHVSLILNYIPACVNATARKPQLQSHVEKSIIILEWGGMCKFQAKLYSSWMISMKTDWRRFLTTFFRQCGNSSYQPLHFGSSNVATLDKARSEHFHRITEQAWKTSFLVCSLLSLHLAYTTKP